MNLSPQFRTILFLRAWLANPAQVGAIVPSSDKLAHLITRDIHPSLAPVLELGPGTGVFTQALIDRGVREDCITLVELNEEFAELLALRFPQARLLRQNAARLSGGDTTASIQYGAIISGLPLLSMPFQTVFRILSRSNRLLRPGGAFFQFTYGLRCPVPQPVLRKLGLEARKVGTVLSNVPPASVYRIATCER